MIRQTQLRLTILVAVCFCQSYSFVAGSGHNIGSKPIGGRLFGVQVSRISGADGAGLSPDRIITVRRGYEGGAALNTGRRNTNNKRRTSTDKDGSGETRANVIIGEAHRGDTGQTKMLTDARDGRTGQTRGPAISKARDGRTGHTRGPAMGKARDRRTGQTRGPAMAKTQDRGSGRTRGPAIGKARDGRTGQTRGLAMANTQDRGSGRTRGLAMGKTQNRGGSRTRGLTMGKTQNRGSGRTRGLAMAKAPSRASSQTNCFECITNGRALSPGTTQPPNYISSTLKINSQVDSDSYKALQRQLSMSMENSGDGSTYMNTSSDNRDGTTSTSSSDSITKINSLFTDASRTESSKPNGEKGNGRDRSGVKVDKQIEICGALIAVILMVLILVLMFLKAVCKDNFLNFLLFCVRCCTSDRTSDLGKKISYQDEKQKEARCMLQEYS